MTDLTVANTILEQLGGNQFRVMTGARNFIGGPKCLSFKLPGKPGYTKNGINYVRITLDPSDTYTMEFIKYRGLNIKVIEKLSDVYNEDLQEVFTRETGLVTSL